MEAKVVKSSASVSETLSQEKKAQLERSQMKAKMTEMDQEGVSVDIDSSLDNIRDEEVVMETTEVMKEINDLFKIATSVALRRKLVSYNEAYLGFNGGSAHYLCFDTDLSDEE
ncbi:hypothetical protein RJT34_07485 [Clitoria ternatea]|uniref:Uncharacterized protein n=1 Tax=Clitoria ternatea TaxID=43366 RepID=A0AAN9K5W7_CLITE